MLSLRVCLGGAKASGPWRRAQAGAVAAYTTALSRRACEPRRVAGVASRPSLPRRRCIATESPDNSSSSRNDKPRARERISHRQENRRAIERSQEDTERLMRAAWAKMPDTCSGCGAAYQDGSETTPGFVPRSFLLSFAEEAEMMEEERNQAKAAGLPPPSLPPPRKLACMRCFQLKQYGQLAKPKRGGGNDAGDITGATTKVQTPMVAPADLRQLLAEHLHGTGRATRTKNEGPDEDVSPSEMLIPGARRNRGVAREISRRAVVVKVVDLFDFNGSFIPNFGRVVGNSPVVIAVNKSDLLPIGAGLNRVQRWLKIEAALYGIEPDAIHLISSTTGEGVPELMKKVAKLAARVSGQRVGREEKRRGDAADVYVVGSTNVGKSTLINQLLRRGYLAPARTSSAADDGEEGERGMRDNSDDYDDENDSDGGDGVIGRGEYDPNEADRWSIQADDGRYGDDNGTSRPVDNWGNPIGASVEELDADFNQIEVENHGGGDSQARPFDRKGEEESGEEEDVTFDDEGGAVGLEDAIDAVDASVGYDDYTAHTTGPVQEWVHLEEGASDAAIAEARDYNSKPGHHRGHGGTRKDRPKRKPDTAAAVTTSLLPGTTLGVVTFPMQQAQCDGVRAYLHDTPGVLNLGCLSSHLQLDELRQVLPSKRIKPVTYRLKQGQSILLGALGRIDHAGGRPFFFTACVAAGVSVHVTSTKHLGPYPAPAQTPHEARQYRRPKPVQKKGVMLKPGEVYDPEKHGPTLTALKKARQAGKGTWWQRNAGTRLLPPYSLARANELMSLDMREESVRRRNEFLASSQADGEEDDSNHTALVGTEDDVVDMRACQFDQFQLQGCGWEEACDDIVFPGLGWVAVTGVGPVTVRAFAPAFTKPHLRAPLMPYESRHTTKRFTGSARRN